MELSENWVMMGMKSIMRIAFCIALGWVIVAPVAVQGQSLSEAFQLLEAERYQPEVYMPYRADEARQQQLITSMNLLETGQPIEEVRQLLGAPDEIHPIFVMGDRTEELHGIQYVYLFSRSKSEEWGLAYHESVIRIDFNLQGQLDAAEGLSVPGFNDLLRAVGLGFDFTMGLHETVKINDLLIRLEVVAGSGDASMAEAASNAATENAYAIFTVSLTDRKDNIRLRLDSGQATSEQSKMYNRYRITLNAIPAANRVALVVE